MPDASGNFKGTGTLPEIPWHVPGANQIAAARKALDAGSEAVAEFLEPSTKRRASLAAARLRGKDA